VFNLSEQRQDDWQPLFIKTHYMKIPLIGGIFWNGKTIGEVPHYLRKLSTADTLVVRSSSYWLVGCTGVPLTVIPLSIAVMYAPTSVSPTLTASPISKLGDKLGTYCDHL